MSGSSSTNQPGVYGTKGVASSINVPGARSGAVSWTDNSRNLWLFGGYGYATGTSGDGMVVFPPPDRPISRAFAAFADSYFGPSMNCVVNRAPERPVEV